jgi:hypothetical protein
MTFGTDLMATASDMMILAGHTPAGSGGSGSSGGAGEASGFIGEILAIAWVTPVLKAMGAGLFIFMVGQFLWNKRKGAQGAGGGAGQLLGGLFGLSLLFSPPLIGQGADAIVSGFTSAYTYVTALF